MSILLVFLWAGVAGAFSVGGHGNDATTEPIPTSDAASSPPCGVLCSLGLVGSRCFRNCLKPTRDDRQDGSFDPLEVCPKLCDLAAGCECGHRSSRVPHEEVCQVLCTFGTRWRGCPVCSGDVRDDGEKESEEEDEVELLESDQFDKEEFCRMECAQGNGGAACRCDILPLNVQVSSEEDHSF